MNKRVLDALDGVGVPVTYIKRKKEPVSVSFFIVNAVPVCHDDDEYNYLDYTLQIDLWAEYGSSVTKLVKDIIKAMEIAGFTLKAIRPDMYEEELNILHKPIEFGYLERVE